MREFLKVVSAFAVVIAFYFGSVLLVNHLQMANRLQERSVYTAHLEEVKLLMAALQGYRRARGSYPMLSAPDSPMVELKQLLVKSQLLPGPYIDPSESDKNSRYVSYDGNNYGLLFRFSRADNGQPVTCKVEVDAPRSTGWWGHPPKCPF
jgi:hypothetical protein